MHITSSPEYLTAQITDSLGVVWYKGSHYANVYEGFTSTNPIDCFSFAWEKDRTSMLDFTSALERFVAEQ